MNIVRARVCTKPIKIASTIAHLQRAESLMSANLPNVSGGDPRSGKMSRRNGTEPLKRFTEAKKAIGEIYNDLEGYVSDLSTFYHEVINGQNIVPEQQMGEVERFMDTIKTIKEIFHRDTMKVVFFGRWLLFFKFILIYYYYFFIVCSIMIMMIVIIERATEKAQ
ncbi:unnamed protein product [Anisakis simplex]|uniref:Transmembrane GTPase fzo-1 (inferred by orthology to a C. elegans protein) n=1 Tax=Anisakis simplex TaxID=6269 RepID=A0A0M3J5H3_ANISI|nr:unnamed protein product [Anisakis simplex]